MRPRHGLSLKRSTLPSIIIHGGRRCGRSWQLPFCSVGSGDCHGCRRQRLQRLIHAESPERITLFSSGTSALNAAILGSICPGDHVVTTQTEHNSVLRPLHHLQSTGVIELSVAPCNAEGLVDCDQVLERVNERTVLVAINHGSNVTGAVQDIARIGQALRNHRALVLCDAAQTLGHLPLDVQTAGIDLLAAPGHKGTYGPLGTALLYVSPKAEQRLKPTVWGGTGSQSESWEMPTKLPERLEAGNLNVPALAGWNAGLDYLFSIDPESARAQDRSLITALQQAFGNDANSPLAKYGFSLIGPDLPLVSLVFDRHPPHEIGTILDSEFGIQTRCGLHCAAAIHEPIEARRMQRPLAPGHMSARCESAPAASTPPQKFCKPPKRSIQFLTRSE